MIHKTSPQNNLIFTRLKDVFILFVSDGTEGAAVHRLPLEVTEVGLVCPNATDGLFLQVCGRLQHNIV